jgi:hypothetical protein
MIHARRLRHMDVPSGDRRAKDAQRSDQASVGRPFFAFLFFGHAKIKEPVAQGEALDAERPHTEVRAGPCWRGRTAAPAKRNSA